LCEEVVVELEIDEGLSQTRLIRHCAVPVTKLYEFCREEEEDLWPVFTGCAIPEVETLITEVIP